MRAKLVTFGLTALATLALALQASPQAIAQGNANKPAAAKKKAAPAPAKPAQAKPAPAPAAPAAAQPATAAKPKPKPKKKKTAAAMAGVPKGVPACIKHLTQMAAKDPLIDYDGHPSEIINGGLLWNDPKSQCSVAGDEAKKKKVLALADAWRHKDAAQVRSLLQELAAE